MPESGGEVEPDASEMDGEPTPAPWTALAALAVLAAAPVLRVGLSAMKNHAVWWTPDLLQTLLASISAETGQQWVGAWSRIGLYHPGPAWYYWAAPFVRLAGDEPWGLVMAASALAALSCGLIIVRVGRVAGMLEAVAITAVLLAGLFQLSVLGVSAPWNPTILILPLTCGIVCVGEVLHRGSWPSILIASACGSLVAQAHLGALPLGVGLLAAALIGGYVVRRRRGLPLTRLALFLVAIWAMVPWLPVAYDAAFGSHNAITTAEYVALGTLHGEPATHPAGISRAISRASALRQVASVGSLTESRVALWAGVDLPAGTSHRPSNRSLPAFALCVIVAALVARPRRSPSLASQVSRVALAALAIHSVAALRVRGEYRAYLISPAAGIGLALWIVVALAAVEGLRSLAAREPGRIPRQAPAFVAVALLVITAIVTLPRFDHAVEAGVPISTQPEAVDLILAEARGAPVRLDLSGGWAVLGPAVRLTLELKQRGVDVSVKGDLRKHFGGDERTPASHPEVLVLRPADRPADGCRYITSYESAAICTPVGPAG